ncbi:hypothetical protein [Nonomuraea salmonea]|uniref:hypothetical protein n=1 Tax=Nonomuraea salmonea TaxID=46181 RepID=UPI002FE8AD32
MNTAAKLGSYALGLAVVFGGALGAGKLTAPDPTSAAAKNGRRSKKRGPRPDERRKRRSWARVRQGHRT